MSFGTYIVSAFGLASGIGALAELLASRLPGRWARARARRVAEAAQLPAAVAGLGMSTYTAALLASTSTPSWMAAPRMLGARFGTAAFAAGAAALALGARRRGDEALARRLDDVAALATGAGLATSLLTEGEALARGVRVPVGEAALGLGSIALAEALPLLGYAMGRLAPGQAREASLAASLALVLGNVAMRNEIIRAGNASADQPGDTFRLAQPRRGRR
jgi:hypothetical protein